MTVEVQKSGLTALPIDCSPHRVPDNSLAAFLRSRSAYSWSVPDHRKRVASPEMRPSATRAGALLGLRLRLRFGLRLRVADGLRQHLLKFGLGLCLLARRRLPCRHEHYIGMRQ